MLAFCFVVSWKKKYLFDHFKNVCLFIYLLVCLRGVGYEIDGFLFNAEIESQLLGTDLDCLIEELFEDQLGVFVFMVRSSDNYLSIFANRIDRLLHLY